MCAMQRRDGAATLHPAAKVDGVTACTNGLETIYSVLSEVYNADQCGP